ncbi:MAG TPA: nucleotide exchange factor GrpE [Pirellulales bacterium]|nr:nucleotide exchange factor GrpE [Pirellulales bacterium]
MSEREDGKSTETTGSRASQSAVEMAAAPDELETLRQELDAAKDRALRVQAELENYRKRVRREMDDERRYAQLPLLKELLPVIDNIGRALQSAEKSPDGSGLLEGVKLVAQQLDGVLSRHHCQRIEALHQPFDPHLHEAILQQPSADYPAGTVLNVTQEGYQLHDRVVRPAQVIVSTTPPAGDATITQTKSP